MRPCCLAAAVTLCLLTTSPAQEPVPYGPAIPLEVAQKVMRAAEAEAREHHWPVAISIVDNAGFLVLFQRLDNTQLASVEVAIEKARTAVLFRRPTKAFEDRLAVGGAELKLLKLPGLPLEGGLPLVHDGQIIGGIGVSGVQSTQDGQVAAAGAKVLEGPAGVGPTSDTEDDVAPVKGIVTMNGKPLPRAALVFLPLNQGRPSLGWTDENGQYVLSFSTGRKGAIPGQHTVRITTRSDPTTDEKGQLVPGTPETVPTRYNVKSQLTCVVQPDSQNEFDFHLSSDGLRD
jgi:uncharacterized protein GlcG (DUF336 family)